MGSQGQKDHLPLTTENRNDNLSVLFCNMQTLVLTTFYLLIFAFFRHRIHSHRNQISSRWCKSRKIVSICTTSAAACCTPKHSCCAALPGPRQRQSIKNGCMPPSLRATRFVSSLFKSYHHLPSSRPAKGSRLPQLAQPAPRSSGATGCNSR